MSEIYVNWADLYRVADHISTYTSKINRCNKKVEAVRKSLKMSSNLSETIVYNLKKDEEVLDELENSVSKYYKILESISSKYKSTENGLK